MRLSNKIGVIVDSFGLGVRPGLLKAKEVGADGVQLYAVEGEMEPERLDPASRRELRSYIGSLGLEISALVGDLGGHGFQDRGANPAKIQRSKRILELALELGTRVVTTHIGIVPEDRNGEVYHAMQAACEELAGYAHRNGAYFAIETGPETAAHLKSFLDTLGSKGVSVNYDPANLVMVTGDDPVQGVYTLKDYIVHTHVKDGIRLTATDPRNIYGALGYERVRGEYYKEVPLGDGSVDFPAYFAALQDIGYSGYLTIERETGDRPEQDIRRAVDYIKQFR
ncbi:sugar phosphate isomerase/epimerase family protein [Gorillibacterium sp. sgz5001074]|uniref:sugar phosphate isomerase/epimerase family protein n=1 Tax=Gorillibacterium sp. sgz5001074 TaxID=3446695 RepID=UPI003F67AF07